jgi:hypothetical protein
MLGKYSRIGTGFIDVYLDMNKILKYSMENKEKESQKEVQEKFNKTDVYKTKKDVKPVTKSIDKKHTDVGEIVSRKTFTKSQLKVPKEHIFRSSEVVEKEKHETFTNYSKKYTKKNLNQDSTPIQKEKVIEKDIQTKYKRSKVGLQISESRNAVEF